MSEHIVGVALAHGDERCELGIIFTVKAAEHAEKLFVAAAFAYQNKLAELQLGIKARFCVDFVKRVRNSQSAALNLCVDYVFSALRGLRNGDFSSDEHLALLRINCNGGDYRGFVNIHKPEVVCEEQTRKQKKYQPIYQHGQFAYV